VVTVRVPDHDVMDHLRSTLAGPAGGSLVLLGNFEVENEWAAGESGLPQLAMAESRVVVNRMDEFALLLAEPSDYVVLKAFPDQAYLAYLERLGLALPAVLAPGRQDPQRTVTEDVLADPALLATLSGLTGARLWPHGVSDREERLAASAGLPLAPPPAAVCKLVNSKVYSRRIAAELGLRQPLGLACRDLDELARACEQARAWQAAGRTVVCKDAYGVSGKGILVLRSSRVLDQLHRMIVRQAGRSGRQDVGLVLEEWVAKDADLNYQFTVGRGGKVTLDFVKEAVTDGGVHRGHWMPAGLADAHMRELQEAACLLGGRLARDGYFGVVGVDALLGSGQRLYPVIEINARNNMSTYQERLRHAFIGSGRAALATHYPLRLRDPLPFAALTAALDGTLFTRQAGTGLLINNFATVNAGAALGARSFEGRLYGIVVADTRDRVVSLDGEIRARLAALTQGARDEP
jgi:Pre ATP-grasp domain/ATP-grasp domain